MATITFNNADVDLKFKNKKSTKGTIIKMFSDEGKELESLSIVFCSDNFLLDLNKRFLDHDYFTDILTFDLTPQGEIEVVGELYISIDRVRDNAFTINESFQNELQRVIIHGALHLCGYKDKTISQIKKIRAKEDYYLQNP